jgi:hypothetical protein
MTNFGKLCYAFGIIVAVVVGMRLSVPHTQGGAVSGSIDCNTPGLYVKQNDCVAKSGHSCIHSRQRCKAPEEGDSYLCKSEEGSKACDASGCVVANRDALSTECTKK